MNLRHFKMPHRIKIKATAQWAHLGYFGLVAVESSYTYGMVAAFLALTTLIELTMGD